MKRTPGRPAYEYSHALGVLAYARSFQKIAAARWSSIHKDRPAPFVEFFDLELQDSLNAAREGDRMQFERVHSLRIQTIAIAIALVAVYVSLLQTVGQFKDEKMFLDRHSRNIIALVVESLWLFVLIPPLMVGSAWMVCNQINRGSLPGWIKEYIYGGMRALLAFPRNISGFAILVLGAIVLVLSICVSLWLLTL